MTDRRGYHFLCLQSWATTKTVTHPSMHCGLLQTWKPYTSSREDAVRYLIAGTPNPGTFRSASLTNVPSSAKSFAPNRAFQCPSRSIRSVGSFHRAPSYGNVFDCWKSFRERKALTRALWQCCLLEQWIVSCPFATLRTGRQLILPLPE